MSVIQLNLSDDLLTRAREIARERALPVEQVIADAPRRMIESKDEMKLLQQRATRGRAVDIKSILRKAPDRAPDPTDRIE
jgi:hypothetical protein